MAIYRVVGDALVTDQEFIEKLVTGELRDFTEAPDRKAAPVKFSTGQLTADNHISAYTTATGETVPFEPVGPGKPLTIEIRYVYTGRFPERNFWTGSSADMLLTSAMKSLVSFNAAPRALNFIERDVKPNHAIKSPAATEEGTALVHYSPALVERSLVLTLEMGFNRFDQAKFDQVSSFFTQASQMPVFLTASVALGSASMPAGILLLAGGAITKIVGSLAESLIDRSPVFKATDSLDFLRPGVSPLEAGFRVIFEGEVSEDWLSQHKWDSGILTDMDGHAYTGEIPYVIISVDGAENKAYDNFGPTAASAALLDQFYSVGEGQGQSLEPLLDALKLYNDWEFRKKADQLKESLVGLDPASEQYQQLQAEYDAAVANIRDPLFRPQPDPQ